MLVDSMADYSVRVTGFQKAVVRVGQTVEKTVEKTADLLVSHYFVLLVLK
jgi:hypothetical protein